MKRKLFTIAGVAAIALALVFGLAGCDNGNDPGGGGDTFPAEMLGTWTKGSSTMTIESGKMTLDGAEYAVSSVSGKTINVQSARSGTLYIFCTDWSVSNGGNTLVLSGSDHGWDGTWTKQSGGENPGGENPGGEGENPGEENPGDGNNNASITIKVNATGTFTLYAVTSGGGIDTLRNATASLDTLPGKSAATVTTSGQETVYQWATQPPNGSYYLLLKTGDASYLHYSSAGESSTESVTLTNGVPGTYNEGRIKIAEYWRTLQ